MVGTILLVIISLITLTFLAGRVIAMGVLEMIETFLKLKDYFSLCLIISIIILVIGSILYLIGV